MNGSKPFTVGILYSGKKKSLRNQLDELYKGLQDIDPTFVKGKGISIIGPLHADDDYKGTLPQHAQYLIQKELDVLVAAGGPVSALAALAETNKQTGKKTSIVFTSVADPVKSGLVNSPNLPGKNLTGVAGLTSELDAERLGLLYELLGKDNNMQLGALINPDRPMPPKNEADAALQKQILQAAATSLGLSHALRFGEPSGAGDIRTEIQQLSGIGIKGLLVAADPFFNSEADTVIKEVADNLPAIYQWPEFVEGGGLMSYGPSINDEYFQAGRYAGLILSGQQPGNMALYKPSRDTFRLFINRTTFDSLKKKFPISIPSAWNNRHDLVWLN